MNGFVSPDVCPPVFGSGCGRQLPRLLWSEWGRGCCAGEDIGDIFFGQSTRRCPAPRVPAQDLTALDLDHTETYLGPRLILHKRLVLISSAKWSFTAGSLYFPGREPWNSPAVPVSLPEPARCEQVAASGAGHRATCSASTAQGQAPSPGSEPPSACRCYVLPALAPSLFLTF